MAFEFLKKQFRKVLVWEETDRNVIVYKYPLQKKEEIMKNSQLVVKEGQKAIFVQEGKIADVFGPGTYELSDIRNIPILTQLYNWKYAWESPYKGDVYYVSTRQFIDNKWGTANPVIMRDQDFGMVRVRGFGIYSFSVNQPTSAMNELFGATGKLTVSDVDNYFRKIITSVLSNVIAESQVPVLDLSMNYDDLSVLAKNKMAQEFDSLGIKINSLYIENLSVPEEIEKMMDKKTTMSVIGKDMNQYMQMETMEAMKNASTTSNSMGGIGMGLGAGLQFTKMMADTMGQVNSPNQNTQSARKEMVECPNCHNGVEKGVKFCPHCGKSMVVASGIKCAKCGAVVPSGTKFCPECGAKIITKNTCLNCGADIPPGVKYCPECGEEQ